MKKIFLVMIALSLLMVQSCSYNIDKEREEYAGRVKAAFQKAWVSYMDYAKGLDGVNPIAEKGHTWYSESLLMTPVDAYSTMCVMGLEKEKAEAKELIFTELDFDKDMKIQQFEIAIRMMGGLISAYQLDGDERFLTLAQDLADRMLPVFDSPTGMPYKYVNLRTGEVSGAETNPCEIGSMLLEYGMLSKLTGNPIYYEKCKAGVKALYNLRNKETDLVASAINVETGEWLNAVSHISGGIDAYYEYLLKGWLLFKDEELKDMWNVHKVAIDKYIRDDRFGSTWYGQADMTTGERLSTTFCALDCFYGGCLYLDGDIETAESLQKSIYKMWTLNGIEPELIDYSNMEILNPSYYARPEAIEATYYSWVFTGKDEYYQQGKTMFKSIEKYCQLKNGYCQLKDVRTKEHMDTLESFFFAETMMYCYLFFAPHDAFDMYSCVLSTEAHPLFNDVDLRKMLN